MTLTNKILILFICLIIYFRNNLIFLKIISLLTAIYIYYIIRQTNAEQLLPNTVMVSEGTGIAQTVLTPNSKHIMIVE